VAKWPSTVATKKKGRVMGHRKDGLEVLAVPGVFTKRIVEFELTRNRAGNGTAKFRVKWDTLTVAGCSVSRGDQ